MTKENLDSLKERFPQIFFRLRLNNISCGDRWFSIIEEMCENKDI